MGRGGGGRRPAAARAVPDRLPARGPGAAVGLRGPDARHVGRDRHPRRALRDHLRDARAPCRRGATGTRSRARPPSPPRCCATARCGAPTTRRCCPPTTCSPSRARSPRAPPRSAVADRRRGRRHLHLRGPVVGRRAARAAGGQRRADPARAQRLALLPRQAHVAIDHGRRGRAAQRHPGHLRQLRRRGRRPRLRRRRDLRRSRRLDPLPRPPVRHGALLARRAGGAAAAAGRLAGDGAYADPGAARPDAPARPRAPVRGRWRRSGGCWRSACATSPTPTATRRRSSGCPAASTRPWRPAWRSTPSAPRT